MSGLSKKGLSILMALLMSVSTVGVLETVVSAEGTLVASAASAISVNELTCDIGEKITFDTKINAEIVVDKSGVVNVTTYKINEGTKRVTLLCMAPGQVDVQVKDSLKVIKEYKIKVNGTVNTKSVVVTTVGKQYIVPDASVKGLFTVQGDKFVSGDKFGAKLVDGKVQVWGKADTTWKLRVVTNKSVTDYTIKFVKEKYEYARGMNIRKGDGNPVESVTSSNKDVVQVTKTESAYFNLRCNSNGTSTINVKYTDGRTETYDIKVRDSKELNIADTGVPAVLPIFAGGNKTFDYTKVLEKNGIEYATLSSISYVSNDTNSVKARIDGNKITFTAIKDRGPNTHYGCDFKVCTSNGDYFTLYACVYAAGNQGYVYTYKDLKIDLNEINKTSKKDGVDLTNVKIKSCSFIKDADKKYFTITKSSDGKYVTIHKKIDIDKKVQVVLRMELSNGIVLYPEIQVANYSARSLNMTVNTSKDVDYKTIQIDRPIKSYTISNADKAKISVSLSGNTLKLKALKTGTVKIELRTEGSYEKTILTVNIKPSNNTYNKTIGYNKDGTKIAVVELKNTGATVEKAVVDKADMAEILTNPYSIVVKPKKAGVSTITVTCTNGDIIKYVCTVKARYNTYNKTIGYNVNGTKIAVVELKNTGGKVKTVSVDNTGVMAVVKNDYSVVLKPKKAGKATVTVTCTTGDVVKYVCTVNSLSKTYNKTVTLDTKNAKTMDVNADVKLKDKGLKITKVENKSSALLKNVTKGDYNFKYTMIKKGTAIVKVTLSNGDIITYNIVIK